MARPRREVAADGGEDADASRPDTRTRRWPGIAAAGVLVIGTCASVLGAHAWSSYVRVQATRTFETSASTAAEALTTALQRDSDLAATARVLVETTPSLAHTNFTTWFTLLQKSNGYPGSFALLYIERVAPSQLPAFRRAISLDPPFGLPSGAPARIAPSGAKPPYCLTRAGAVQVAPSLHISMGTLVPLLSLASSDLDLCALPMGKLLTDSGRTGKPAAIGLASLVASAPRLPGSAPISRSLITMFRRAGLVETVTPVYAGTPPPGALTSGLEGWILGVYQAKSILAPILDGRHGFSAVLSFENPTGRLVVLDRTGTTGGGMERSFHLAGPGPWSVTLSGTAGTSSASPLTQGVVVLGGGLLLTLLLFLLVRMLVRSRRRAIKLVGERTAQLQHLALHDALTGLPNRSLAFAHLEESLATARTGGNEIAVLLVDLDQFADVNDRVGHKAGDEVLRQVAERFRASVRSRDTVGRLGGDEFVVVLEGDGAADAEEVAERLIAALRAPFAVSLGKDRVQGLRASIGIARGVRDTAEMLLGDADIARYEAKATVGGGYLVFRPDMRAAVATRIALEAELRIALAEGQFFVVYQPIFDLRSGTVLGAEALVRWRHPERGVVGPDEFVPTLEATGMILDVGRFVLEQACVQAAEWRRRRKPIYVSVNLSARQLDRGNFVESVRQVLRDVRLGPSALALEITETTLMRNAELSAHRLGDLKKTGVKLVIDDFGTGYCSLAYLQKFPVDALKIDRSFISATDSQEGKSLVRTILRLGSDLKLETVAEGIESEEQLGWLVEEGCHAGQGFLFARPLEAPAMLKLLDHPAGVRAARRTAAGDVRA